MIELRAGMKQVIEIENIVVGGRRPHGLAPFKDELRDCRAGIVPRGLDRCGPPRPVIRRPWLRSWLRSG
jgi:hypothetical protein